MKNDENMIAICNSCSTHFDTNRLEEYSYCPCFDCNGIIKHYNVNGAVIVNALDCSGYKVISYSFPDETNKKRLVELEFADAYDFIDHEPPEGFTYKKGYIAVRGSDQAFWTHTYIYKSYKISMPHWEYTMNLLKDKATLHEWAFSLPYVKDYFEI